MAHKEQKDFFKKVKQLHPDSFKNVKVLEVGSLDVNGTHRELFENSSYIGIDIDEGPNVDIVSIGHLYDAPDNHFDTIISGSVFEHDMYYEKTFTNIMRMLKPGGLFLFTCGGPGYPEHGTKKTGTQQDAPLLGNISEEWANYYKNLDPDMVKKIPNFLKTFPDGYFEVKSTEIAIPSDLYFYGFKGGNINPENFKIRFGVNEKNYLFCEVTSDFNKKHPDKVHFIEINYDNYNSFHQLEKEVYLTKSLGEYKKGKWVTVYHEGIEIFKEFLSKSLPDVKEPILENLPDVKEPIRKKNNRDKRSVNFNFIDGPFIEIIEDNEYMYNVEFIDTKTNKVEFEMNVKSNHWCKASKKYYIDWLIRITGIDTDFHYEHKYNPKGGQLLISFESESLGDSLSWMPYVEEFREKHKCNIICSTFNNGLFEKEYPHINFVSPGETVQNIYGGYNFGLYFEDGHPEKHDSNRNPTDARKLPLGKIASDILGLDYVEKKPKITLHKNIKKKKQASIAIHSTAQAKYWNNPTGWQEVVDYLKSKDYDVILLSKEEDGYMGNNNPKGVKNHKKGSLSGVIKTIQESELFIGISGGLSWLSWSIGTPTVLISGFTDEVLEPRNDIHRIINKDVCHGCWSNHKFDKSKWDWCPVQYGTDKMFECSKSISSEMVIKEIDKIIDKT